MKWLRVAYEMVSRAGL